MSVSTIFGPIIAIFDTGFLMILGPIFAMAAAFLMAILVGYHAGSTPDDQQVGIAALGLCILAFLAQAALWVWWALIASGVI